MLRCPTPHRAPPVGVSVALAPAWSEALDQVSPVVLELPPGRALRRTTRGRATLGDTVPLPHLLRVWIARMALLHEMRRVATVASVSELAA